MIKAIFFCKAHNLGFFIQKTLGGFPRLKKPYVLLFILGLQK